MYWWLAGLCSFYFYVFVTNRGKGGVGTDYLGRQLGDYEYGGIESGTDTLNKIAFKRNEAITFEKMMLARGLLCSRARGMTGRSTRLST